MVEFLVKCMFGNILLLLGCAGNYTFPSLRDLTSHFSWLQVGNDPIQKAPKIEESQLAVLSIKPSILDKGLVMRKEQLDLFHLPMGLAVTHHPYFQKDFLNQIYPM